MLAEIIIGESYPADYENWSHPEMELTEKKAHELLVLNGHQLICVFWRHFEWLIVVWKARN